MTQIKLFKEKTPEMSSFEKKVNDFLAANAEKIIVKDIKYTAEIPNPGNTCWAIWTVMVYYEVID